MGELHFNGAQGCGEPRDAEDHSEGPRGAQGRREGGGGRRPGRFSAVEKDHTAQPCPLPFPVEAAAGGQLRGPVPGGHHGARQDNRRGPGRGTPGHRERGDRRRDSQPHDGVQPGGHQQGHRRGAHQAAPGGVQLCSSLQLPLHGAPLVHALRRGHGEHLRVEAQPVDAAEHVEGNRAHRGGRVPPWCD